MGSALPVVLLPGMDGSAELRRDIAERLSIARPVVIIAYPADRPMGYSDLVCYVRSRLPQGPFIILGESFSGPIAIEIAASEPRAAGLVLVSSFASAPLPSFLARFTGVLTFKRAFRHSIEVVLMGACAPQALKLQLRKALSEVRGEVLTKRAKETLRVDALPALKRVVVPVLCLAGRFDQLIGKSSVRRIVAASPKAHVCWFDAPHMLLQMCPAEAAVEINNFCGLLSPRTCTV